jgi:peroxiredoxin
MSKYSKKVKWFFGSIVSVLISIIVFVGFVWNADRHQWLPVSVETSDTVLFEPHIENHPSHFSFSQKISTASKIDMIDLLSGSRFERFKEGYEKFQKMAPVGTAAPDFKLETTDGKTIKMSDKRGKIVVFMFVAMTCPPARMQVPLWSKLSKKYNSKDVEFFTIYSREQHPGEQGYREFTQTSSYEQKFEYATMLAELTDLPVAVDTIGMSTLNHYGVVPNAAFVVDHNGLIVFKSTWSDHQKIEIIVDMLLAFYDKQKDYSL